MTLDNKGIPRTSTMANLCRNIRVFFGLPDQPA